MSNKNYIVMFNNSDSFNTLTAEMTANTGSGNVPNRSVTEVRSVSSRLRAWYEMTDAEALTLKNDDRVDRIFILGDRLNPI